MAIKFCQIEDSCFSTAVVYQPHVEDRVKFAASEKLLIDRLQRIATALQEIGVRFGYGSPRFLDWKPGEFQYRADCVAVKPRGMNWNTVYEAINAVEAVAYDKVSDEHAEHLLVGMTTNIAQAKSQAQRVAEERRRTILQQNPLVRPNRPKTNMRLVGVTAYGIDLAVMLSVLLQRHGYLQHEPEDLSALLTAGDLAVAEAEAHLDDMKQDLTTFEDAQQFLDAALTIPEVHRLVEQMDAGANADKPSVRFSATDWEAWTQVVSAKVHTLEADSPPNVNDRVYFCSQDDPTQSGWYLLHRVRNVSGQIDSPDCLVTLCRENNEPGEYINTVASQIHRTQP